MTLPDLMGGASEPLALPRERSSDATLHLAERLLNLGDPYLEHRVAPRLIRCATNVVGWRCGITSICPRCGRRQAVRDRISVQASCAGAGGPRSLVTRTLLSPSILEGHRALVEARRAQGRSAAWRASFVRGRGRIEVKRTAGDDAWLVHAHEVAVRAAAAVDVEALEASWSSLVGSLGLAGSLDVRPIGEGGSARGGRTFRRAELLRDEAPPLRAPRALGRRAARVVHDAPAAPLRGEVRAAVTAAA